MDGEQLFAVMCFVVADTDSISVKAVWAVLIVGSGAINTLSAPAISPLE